MTDKITFAIACPDCGSEQIKQPTDFDFDTNFVGVSCAVCGREITKDDVIKQATDRAAERAKRFIDDMFKDHGFK